MSEKLPNQRPPVFGNLESASSGTPVGIHKAVTGLFHHSHPSIFPSRNDIGIQIPLEKPRFVTATMADMNHAEKRHHVLHSHPLHPHRIFACVIPLPSSGPMSFLPCFWIVGLPNVTFPPSRVRHDVNVKLHLSLQIRINPGSSNVRRVEICHPSANAARLAF